MRTQDVKVNCKYLLNGKIVTVIERVSGEATSKPNMQSGMMFTGYKHKQKRFRLDTGELVYAQKLTEI